MASSLQFLLFCIILLFFVSLSNAKPKLTFHPRALVLPVWKDASTNQYVTHIKQRTPLVSINLVLDLGGEFMWVDCDQGYVSSSYIPAHCRSAKCSLARANGCGECFSAPKPGCNNNTCSMFPANSVNGPATSGELAQDVISVQSTNGKNPGPIVSVPHYLFTCGGVKGMAGLGRARIGMPSLFAAAFSLQRKFAICLTSSPSANGVIFFGNGSYVMLPNIDLSSSLIYTPLLTNPVSTAPVYTQVKSIKVNERSISVNKSLLSIHSDGYGGTKISTVNLYTVLETSIYNALTKAFVKYANLTRVASVAPFGFCFDSKNVVSTRVGPAVPSIDLVLQSKKIVWRIFGSNSMVQVSKDVLCLGFVDGGSNPRTSIVIGGHQLENNFLQFDLATSRLGFSSSLLSRQTTCSNFNFTSSV
ncbi:hypothetical protein AQUCO_01700406v1 [Aquilegia coerulea]|uniref:Peptidase A1 domain-containing protein n=1 Tax=Aquilegia coerulea TaxID=218851 RepID=A0A2G5DMP3_AQUCA|nr:hypothetical protein AQUCO_01700406v1 [Aquilegia coerulea]